LIPAHQSFYRLGVEGFSKKLEVVLLLLLKAQLAMKATQGHVGDGQEVCEGNTETLSQFPPVFIFEGGLRRRQKGTSRIINKT
jgi:hypothetical protein